MVGRKNVQERTPFDRQLLNIDHEFFCLISSYIRKIASIRGSHQKVFWKTDALKFNRLIANHAQWSNTLKQFKVCLTLL